MSPARAPPRRPKPSGTKPPGTKPPRSPQWKLGVALGLLGGVLWVVHMVRETAAVFHHTRREFRDPTGERSLERMAERMRRRDREGRGTDLRAEVEEQVQEIELVLHVFRRGEDAPWTGLQVKGSETIHSVPAAGDDDDRVARDARDAALEAIGREVSAYIQGREVRPLFVSVRIVATETAGGAVPPDDIDRLTNILYRLGIADVLYEDGR